MKQDRRLHPRTTGLGPGAVSHIHEELEAGHPSGGISRHTLESERDANLSDRFNPYIHKHHGYSSPHASLERSGLARYDDTSPAATHHAHEQLREHARFIQGTPSLSTLEPQWEAGPWAPYPQSIGHHSYPSPRGKLSDPDIARVPPGTIRGPVQPRRSPRSA